VKLGLGLKLVLDMKLGFGVKLELIPMLPFVDNPVAKLILLGIPPGETPVIWFIVDGNGEFGLADSPAYGFEGENKVLLLEMEMGWEVEAAGSPFVVENGEGGKGLVLVDGW